MWPEKAYSHREISVLAILGNANNAAFTVGHYTQRLLRNICDSIVPVSLVKFPRSALSEETLTRDRWPAGLDRAISEGISQSTREHQEVRETFKCKSQ